MAGVVVAVALVAIGGCGRISFDPLGLDASSPFDAGDPADGGLDSDVRTEAGLTDAPIPMVDATPADGGVPALLRFRTPSLVAGVSMPAVQDQDPCLSTTGLELYFVSDRPGGLGSLDVWVARRTTPTEGWAPPEHVPELSSTALDGFPRLAPDGLSIFVTSRRPTTFDIYLSTRMAGDATWTTPVRVVELSDDAEDDVCATFDASGVRAALASSRAPTTMGTMYDVYLSDRVDASGTWTAPVPVLEVNTPSVENGVWLGRAGTALAFYSDRAGGMGGYDIYFAARESDTDLFHPPGALATINSPADDTDPFLSSAGTYILFASDRSGDYDIYEALAE